MASAAPAEAAHLEWAGSPADLAACLSRLVRASRVSASTAIWLVRKWCGFVRVLFCLL